MWCNLYFITTELLVNFDTRVYLEVFKIAFVNTENITLGLLVLLRTCNNITVFDNRNTKNNKENRN